MFKGRLTTTHITAIAVTILIVLIGFITRFAWNTINETALEQSRSSQLQLVTSLSQQTQATLNNLAGNIDALAGREEIQATSPSPTRIAAALDLLTREVGEYSEGVIQSITRFDFRGVPRYAYPEIDELPDDPNDYMYSVPPSLLALTERGQRVTSEIGIQLYTATRHDTGTSTTLLVAPVDAASLNTEFIVFEVNLEAIFQDDFSFIDLGETGQLWVLNNAGEVQYSARPTPEATSIKRDFSILQLTTLVEPRSDSYSDGDTIREASIARATGLGENLVIFLSVNRDEAQEQVAGNLFIIGAFAVISIISVITIGGMFIWRIGQETRAREAEFQRRQTLRGMLEISRALNSSLDLSTVLQRILAELEKLVRHESASIMLIEDSELRSAAYRGIEATDTPETLQIDEARAAREVITTGYAVLINDTAGDDRWTSAEGDIHAIAAWMGIPLRVREELVGVLNINSQEKNRFTPEDMELAETFADQASIALQNARLHEIEVKQIEQELIIARGIQTSLLPSKPPDIPQLQVVTNSLPARQVSGDYFQYINLPNGKTLFAIGDVQGKGIPAALMMAVISTAMRDETMRYDEPSSMMHALNLRLLDRMQQNDMNSALLLAIYDAENNQLEIANAGMVQPYLRLGSEETFDFVPVGGYPLGVSDRMRYNTKTIQLDELSTIVMFSDGVVEAQNKAGEFFGFDRIEALLNELPKDMGADEIRDRILNAVKEHLGELDPQDDTTIMIIRSLPQAEIKLIVPEPVTAEKLKTASAELPPIPTNEEPIPEVKFESNGIWQNVEISLPSKLGYELVARGTIAAVAREVGFAEAQIEDMKTAVSEACMNAIEHGNAEEGNRPVRVLLSASRDRMEIRIADTGRKLLATELPAPGSGDMRGWGLFLIRNLMDEFEIRHLPEGGNQIYMALNRRRKDETSEYEKSLTKEET